MVRPSNRAACGIWSYGICRAIRQNRGGASDDTGWPQDERPERGEFLADLAREHALAIFLTLADLFGEADAGALYLRVIANMLEPPDVRPVRRELS
jgi:hypothetical protein